jgi:hypothetical protein
LPFCILPFFHLELRRQLQVESPWREVIWNRVFFPVDVGDPEIGNGIADLQQVEDIE